MVDQGIRFTPEDASGLAFKLRQLTEEDTVYLSLRLCSEFLDPEEKFIKTLEQLKEEGEYLADLLRKRPPKNIKPDDSDKLWLSAFLLLPPKEAVIAYEVIRQAEIPALGGKVPYPWKAEDIHRELLTGSMSLLNTFNRRQIIVGASSELKLLSNELNLYPKTFDQPHKKGLSKKQKIPMAIAAGAIMAAAIAAYEPPKPIQVKPALARTLTGKKQEIVPPPTIIPEDRAVLIKGSNRDEAQKPQDKPSKKPDTGPVPVKSQLQIPAQQPNTMSDTETHNPLKIKKDLFSERIAPILYKRIENLRLERQKTDPQYLQRINENLNKGRINILITGGRVEDLLTDSIQLISYNVYDNTAHIISLPRDLQSPEVLKAIGTQTRSRINEAIGIGGVELLRETMENATGLSVDMYLHANFDLLVDIISRTVGTIDVELETPLAENEYPTEDFGYKSIYYPAGKNTLTGEQALEVARSRHSTNDYERSKRQQKIIEAFIKKLLSQNFIDLLGDLKLIDDIWYQKLHSGRVKPDFDLNQMLFSDLLGLTSQLPQALWDRVTGGVKIAEMPTVQTASISNRNFVVGAGVPGTSITKITAGNPFSPRPREDYWGKVRDFTQKFLTGQ